MSRRMHARSQFLVVGIIFLGLGLVQAGIWPELVKADSEPLSTLTLIQPDGVDDTLAEIDEFATFQIGDPWDMNQVADLQLYHTYDSFFENERFADGLFWGNLTRGDGSEYLMPLYAGGYYHDAMRIGRIGYNYPINADYYRYLTFRMYYDGPPCLTGLVRWSEDDTRELSVSGVSNTFYVPPKPDCYLKSPGWEIYTLDLKALGIQSGGKPWGGIVRELRIIPVGGAPVGTQIKIDWIRLTHADPTSARPYVIRWQGASGKVKLYASPGDKVLDDRDVYIGTADGPVGQYQWQTGVMEAGSYYIYATDGVSSAWSRGPVVLKAPPVGRIEAPSKRSGGEYSTIEIGNAWDMSDPADINLSPPPPWNICMDHTVFANGIFSAQTPACPAGTDHNDPMIFLGGMDRYPAGTPDPEVNTQRYHYLSFRYYLEGDQDMDRGWVARFFWWKMNATDNDVVEPAAHGRDIILYEGWNTYELDLWADDAIDDAISTGIPWAQAHPNRLRLDPNELYPELSPGRIHLDWVKLTADPEVTRGKPYAITFSTGDDNVSYQIFYDTDRDPSNGQVPIQIYAPKVSFQGEHKVFIPAVVKASSEPGELLTGHRVQWDTAQVPAGQYWISVVLNDGYNTTRLYSDIPIQVR